MSKRTHGLSNSSTYRSYNSMKDRCINPNNQDFKHYGGRGIKVCSRWLESFENFLEDMGEKPEGHSLERLDFNGNYEPSNCIWLELRKQQRNKRSNQFITAFGETKCIAEWCEYFNLNYAAFFYRFQTSGLEGEDLINSFITEEGQTRYRDYWRSIQSQKSSAKIMSEESKLKISKANKGRSSPMKGVPKSEETKTKLSKSKSMNWYVKPPDGQEYLISNLRNFCLDNNLDKSSMLKVANGKSSQHKGWLCRRA